MIFQNLSLHNVEELVPDGGGMLCQRIPESVRSKMKSPGAMLMPAGSEIRLVSDCETVKLTLSANKLPFSPARVSFAVFCGDYQVAKEFSVGASPETLELDTPTKLFGRKLPYVEGRPWSFSPRVLRLCPRGWDSAQLRVHSVEGAVRPPSASELPKLRGLAYGTSITHGFSAGAQHLTYAAQMARRLGSDMVNLGVGASAFCEPELADYIAARKDWDFATLEISVNMLSVELDEYAKRIERMVDAVGGSDSSRPVFCITICPCGMDFDPEFLDKEAKAPLEEYRKVLRKAVKNSGLPNVHLLEGSDILKDFNGLSVDLLHPADNAGITMGENLAAAIRPFLRR